MIREFNFINIKGEEIVMVEISDENGNATQMTKALYDEQQAKQPALLEKPATKK